MFQKAQGRPLRASKAVLSSCILSRTNGMFSGVKALIYIVLRSFLFMYGGWRGEKQQWEREKDSEAITTVQVSYDGGLGQGLDSRGGEDHVCWGSVLG